MSRAFWHGEGTPHLPARKRTCASADCDLPAMTDDVFCAACALIASVRRSVYDPMAYDHRDLCLMADTDSARRAVPLMDRVLFRVPGMGEGYSARDLLTATGAAVYVYALVCLALCLAKR